MADVIKELEYFCSFSSSPTSLHPIVTLGEVKGRYKDFTGDVSVGQLSRSSTGQSSSSPKSL